MICVLDCRIGVLGSKNEEKSNMQVAEQNLASDSNFNLLKFFLAPLHIHEEGVKLANLKFYKRSEQRTTIFVSFF